MNSSKANFAKRQLERKSVCWASFSTLRTVVLMKKLCSQARARLQIPPASIKANTGNLQHFLRKGLEITSEGTSANHLTLVPQDFGSSVRGAAASKGTPLTICCNLLAKVALGASINSTLMVSKLSRGELACCPDGSKISQPLGAADRFTFGVQQSLGYYFPSSLQQIEICRVKKM